MTDETPGIGDNSGEEVSAVRLELDVEHAKLVEIGTAWYNNVKAIVDQETAGKADNFIDRMTKYVKKVEANKTEEREPTKIIQAEIKAYHEGLVDPLRPIKERLTKLKTSFLQEEQRKIKVEQDRIAAEEREAERKAEEARKAAEDEDNLAATQEAERLEKEAEAKRKESAAAQKQTASSKGSTAGKASSLRNTYSAIITDFDAALIHYKEHPAVVSALHTAADQTARSPEARKASHDLKDIPGVELKVTQKSV